MSTTIETTSSQNTAQTSIFDILGAEDDYCILSSIPTPLTRESILADLSKRYFNRYEAMMALIFSEKYQETDAPIPFTKDDLIAAAESLLIDLPQNLSDIVYALRHRSPIPDGIQQTARPGQEWVIETGESGQYSLVQRPNRQIEADPTAFDYLLEDQTPKAAREFGMKGAPLLDCILRNNEILKEFLGSTVEHLQSQVRTNVSGVGQVEVGSLFYCEIDEAIIPVTLVAKSGEFNLNKAAQSMKFAAVHHPELNCRPVVAQLLSDRKIALFELTGSSEAPRVLQETHFTLARGSE